MVIDILRASSTIVTALSRGAAAVLPCLTVEEALSIRDRHPPGTVLLGGERGGVRIEGFDLGNSPREYTAEKIRDRFVGFTTTNGTRALLRSLEATKIFVGSFLNLSRIVDVLSDSALPIHLVCAGTDGQITGEDVLFAGAVCQRLTGNDSAGGSSFVLTDSAEIALSMWREQVGPEPNAADADHSTDESQRTLVLSCKLEVVATCDVLGTTRTSRSAARLMRFRFLFIVWLPPLQERIRLSSRLLNDDLQIHFLELPKLRVTSENVYGASARAMGFFPEECRATEPE